MYNVLVEILPEYPAENLYFAAKGQADGGNYYKERLKTLTLDSQMSFWPWGTQNRLTEELRLEVVNADGDLDFVLESDYRDAVINIYTKESHSDPKVLRAKFAVDKIVDSNRKLLSFVAASLDIKLQKPILTLTYPSGTPFEELGIAGRKRPLVLSVCNGIPLIQIDTAYLHYEVTNSPWDSLNIMDRGVFLSKSQFVELNGPYYGVELLDNPVGPLLCSSVIGSYTTYDSSPVIDYQPYDLLRELFHRANFTDFNDSSISQFSLDINGPSVGIYFSGEETFLDAILEMCNSGSGYIYFESGTLYIKRFKLPEYETGQDILEEYNLGSDISITEDTGDYWTGTVKGKKNYATLSDSDFAGGVSDEIRSLFKLNYQITYTTTISTDSVELSRKRTKGNENFRGTLFNELEPIIAEADFAAEIYGSRRFFYTVSVFKDLFSFKIGDMVKLNYPRYGLNNKPVVVVGISSDLVYNRISVTFWG